MKFNKYFLIAYILLMGFAGYWIYLTWIPDVFPFSLQVVLTTVLGSIMGIISWVFFTNIVIPGRKSKKE